MHIRDQVRRGILSCCMLFAASTVVFSQNPAPAKPPAGTQVAPAQVYGPLLSHLEDWFVSLAEAMPEDKYDFVPATTMGEYKGVSTFAEQVKHVAEANAFYFHDPSKPAPDRASFEKLKTKAEIVQALKDSFAAGHAYIDSMTPENAFVALPDGSTRAGNVARGTSHFMDHYGQLVEYLRMNGIVPPASRGGK
ncbi:MAG: DinB family protein [Terracidiphilus sp.]